MIEAFDEVLNRVKDRFRTELDYEARLSACGYYIYVYKDGDVTELNGPHSGRPRVATHWEEHFENDEDKWGKY